MFQRLNKYIHVRPGSVIEDQEEINRFAAPAFDTFDALFYAVKNQPLVDSHRYHQRLRTVRPVS